ncbi:MAG: peptidoglycan-binding protein, partial [Verrucomicrobiota bacterium]
MNSAQFCFCACGLLLAWALAGCSQQSGPESKETRTVTQTLEPADPGQVPQLPEPVVPTLMSELQQLCENMETLPAPFSSIRSEVRQAVADLYTQRQYQPWWFDGEAFESELAESVLDSFSLATLHALDPDDYFPDELRLRWSQMSQVVKADRLRERALTDLVFTLSVTALAYDLHLGRVPHQHVVSTWRGVEKTFDAASLLSRIPGGEPVETILESYAPPHEKYQHLRRALATYRHIAGRGGWEPVDARLLNSLKDRELESGSHPLVPLLRKRLAQEGYAVPPTENPALQDIYDEPLQKVMRQFQANRGLEPDGIVGPLTLKAINIPVEKL